MRTHVAPFGSKFDDLKNNIIKSDNNIVGYIGAMDWLPNQEGVEWFLDHVWSKVLKEAPDAKFHLAGRKMPQKYFAYASDSVIVLGEVDDAFHFMRSCDVMVVPLKSGSGMRVKIIEAMSQEIALVASKTALEGIEAREGRDVFITRDDDAELFAKRIVELLQNKDLALKMGKSAREFVRENFDENEIARRMSEFYKSLLNQ
jgi:glycosyltransferase involved in cell wall biosynthesis